MKQPAPDIRVFQEADGDTAVLDDKTIAVLGYGNLGRPLALNLRDGSRARIIVGVGENLCYQLAQSDGFPVSNIADAAQQAQILLLLVPDEVQPDVYRHSVAPHLSTNDALVFASGFNLAFNLLALPDNVDVLLYAPRMLGSSLRPLFVEGRGYISFVSVEQDTSGEGLALLLGLAKASGSLRRGALEISAKDEAYLDLFGEQAFGPWLGAAMLAAFHVGLKAGLPAEGLLMELYLSGEMAQTFQAMSQVGFFNATRLHGYTAAFGGMARSMSVDRQVIESSMREAIEDIQNGAFAAALREEVEAGYPTRSLLDEMLSCRDVMQSVDDALRQKLG